MEDIKLVLKDIAIKIDYIYNNCDDKEKVREVYESIIKLANETIIKSKKTTTLIKTIERLTTEIQ